MYFVPVRVLCCGSDNRFHCTNCDYLSLSPQSTLNKQLLITLHVLVVTGFAIALIVVLNIGEDDDD